MPETTPGRRKYVSGLADSTARKRLAALKRTAALPDDDPKRYAPAPGDKRPPASRTSSHVAKAGRSGLRERILERARRSSKSGSEAFVEAVAAETDFTPSEVRDSYKRGQAAFGSGRRPGMSQDQWARARVYSMITGGKADADLQAAMRERARARKG